MVDEGLAMLRKDNVKDLEGGIDVGSMAVKGEKGIKEGGRHGGRRGAPELVKIRDELGDRRWWRRRQKDRNSWRKKRGRSRKGRMTDRPKKGTESY